MAQTDRYLIRHEDGTIEHAQYKFSASQISTWMRCNRLWGWTYLMGLRYPSTGAQALGTRVHKQIEVYLGGGQFDMTDEAGQVAFSGLQHLPKPHHELMIEKEFVVRPGDRGFVRHLWWGFKDLEQGNEIWDHKSTSDLKWAKTEEALKYDPQAILYAFDNGNDEVVLNWVYYQTKRSRKSKVVRLVMLQEHAKQAFEVMEDAADEAIEAAKGAYGLDGDELRSYVKSLPYEAKECEAFGGCPNRGLCQLSPAERFAASIKQARKMDGTVSV